MDDVTVACCQIEVSSGPHLLLCGKPAVAQVEWEDGSERYVCREHLAFVLECDRIVEESQTLPAGE